MNYNTRFANLSDHKKLLTLYRKVAGTIGGIARTQHEITEEYIRNNLHNAHMNGVSLVIENPDGKEILAEIHCYKLVPGVFNHILSELTIVVDPDHQSQGLGKLLFSSLLNHIEEKRTDILRVELIARESNQKAIAFYEKIGFQREGRLEKRIGNRSGHFEADIPMAWFNKNYSYTR